MARLASVLVVGAVVGTLGMVATAALAAPGKVVRIERRRTGDGVPRYCELTPGTNQGLCVGAPTVGDKVALLDQTRGLVIGEFRIDTINAATEPWVCKGGIPIIYKVTGTVMSGDPDILADANRVSGLRNLRLDRRNARVMANQTAPHPGEDVEIAVDADGNGTTDMMLTRYKCDERGTPAGSGETSTCFDTYLERNGKLARAHQDIIQICM